MERISRDDNFFELGGDSIVAMRVFARIRTEFGVALPLRLLFEAPVLQALAQHLSVESEPDVEELESGALA